MEAQMDDNSSVTLTRQEYVMTSLNQLPKEIIERFFLLDQAEHDPNDPHRITDASWVPFSTDWPRLMLVCRRFREGALGSTKLWSAIRTDQKRDWIDLCIQRAGDYPLEVYGFLTHRTDETTARTIQLLREIRPRFLRVIVLPRGHGVSQEDQDFAISTFEEENLFEMHHGLVEFEIIFPPESESFSTWSHLTGDNFLGGDNANLTSLCLDTYTIATMPFFPSLRRLVLKRFEVDRFCSNLRRVLLQTPTISVLRLIDPRTAFDDMGPLTGDTMSISDYINGEPPVSLPHLSTLQLTGGLAEVGRLLAVLPNPICTLLIKAQDADDMNDLPVARPWTDLVDLASHILLRAHQYLSMNVDAELPLAVYGITLIPLAHEYTLVQFAPISAMLKVSRPYKTLGLRLITPPGSDSHLIDLIGHASIMPIMRADFLLSLSRLLAECKRIQHLIIWNLPLHASNFLESSSDFDATLPEHRKRHVEKLITAALHYFLSKRRLDEAEPIEKLQINYGPGRLMHDCIPDSALRTSQAQEWIDWNWVRAVQWYKVNEDQTQEII